MKSCSPIELENIPRRMSIEGRRRGIFNIQLTTESSEEDSEEDHEHKSCTEDNEDDDNNQQEQETHRDYFSDIVVEGVTYKVENVHGAICVIIPDPEEEARKLLNTDPSGLEKYTYEQLNAEMSKRSAKHAMEMNRILRLANIY